MATNLLYDRETGRLSEFEKDSYEEEDADFSALEL